MSVPSFTHRLLPYSELDGYLGGVLPFLREGIERGDEVLAVTDVGRTQLLRDYLGDSAERVRFAESASWYGHPSRTLTDCVKDADTAARDGRRLRVLADPAWTGRSPLEVQEWQRVESVANLALARTGAALLCPYARSMPAGVLAAARYTHPETLKGECVQANPLYVEPAAYSAQCDREPLPPPPPEADVLPLGSPNLYWLRGYVTEYVRATALPAEDLQLLLVAVTEVMTNAVEHGSPPITLTQWIDYDEHALVCDVSDRGRWESRSGGHVDLTGLGLLPPGPDDPPFGPGRLGLWAVRLLCSTVQVRTGDRGTVVRMRVRLPRLPAQPPPRVGHPALLEGWSGGLSDAASGYWVNSR